jgi:hypothetical protein
MKIESDASEFFAWMQVAAEMQRDCDKGVARMDVQQATEVLPARYSFHDLWPLYSKSILVGKPHVRACWRCFGRACCWASYGR